GAQSQRWRRSAPTAGSASHAQHTRSEQGRLGTSRRSASYRNGQRLQRRVSPRSPGPDQSLLPLDQQEESLTRGVIPWLFTHGGSLPSPDYSVASCCTGHGLLPSRGRPPLRAARLSRPTTVSSQPAEATCPKGRKT